MVCIYMPQLSRQKTICRARTHDETLEVAALENLGHSKIKFLVTLSIKSQWKPQVDKD